MWYTFELGMGSASLMSKISFGLLALCHISLFLQAYENFIAQVKAEQVDLEHEAGRPTVRPQIKQPKSSPSKSSIALSSSSPSPSGLSGHRDEGSNSSSLDETRDSAESNQTSPALSEGQGEQKRLLKEFYIFEIVFTFPDL